MNNFKRNRLLAGMTQADLAEKLGVSAVTVHKWESGESMPRAKRLKEIAEAMGTTVSNLLEEVS